MVPAKIDEEREIEVAAVAGGEREKKIMFP